jgi:energy-converting hydrogenase B subunit D
MLFSGQCGTPEKNKTMANSPNLAAGTFDGIVVLMLLILAWKLLHSPDLFKAIVLFISFGLVMSLAWVRLKAVDIALAEAAIGAGLTGALFLKALGRLRAGGENKRAEKDARRRSQERKPPISTDTSD